MIVLDTHIWIWWVNGSNQLTADQERELNAEERIGVSTISCWEVAKLVEKGRLELDRPVLEWLTRALRYPGVELVALSPEIAADSAALPGEFHRDPADQILVATARVLGCRLVTSDRKILDYEHVQTLA
ncbi:MAG: type II toxin-antitoxin system VapC family toxin [Bacteroidota bacterium]